MLHYDTAKLHKILKDFYTLTKIKIVLIDNEFNELLAYPSERFEFCDRIRKNLTNNALEIKKFFLKQIPEQIYLLR